MHFFDAESVKQFVGRIFEILSPNVLQSRAGLSLLGYCYYYTQEYALAAECYEQLTKQFPNYPEYRLNHAQSLYNAFLFVEAVNVISQV